MNPVIIELKWPKSFRDCKMAIAGLHEMRAELLTADAAVEVAHRAGDVAQYIDAMQRALALWREYHEEYVRVAAMVDQHCEMTQAPAVLQ